jgi:SPP1 family phage portal protein
LKLTGVRLDDEAIARMKENRVIGLPDRECDVDWLIKSINDVALENYKDRLRKDIHSLSKTPNLDDEEFSGNLSGVAIAYKIWGMDQVQATKERKYKKGLQRRIKLITNILNTAGKNWDWRDIDITFSRNMPQNVVEIADMVTKLRGLVSDETLLSWLPQVEDPQIEMDRIAEQNEGRIDLDSMEVEDEPTDGTGEVG